MLKKQKRSHWRRRRNTLLFFLLIILGVMASPFIWRLERLSAAQNVYDFQTVKEELLWWQAYGGVFNKLNTITDASLWLELNTGKENLEAYFDPNNEKHQFWLFLHKTQKGELAEAQNVLSRLDNILLGQLGQAMLAVAKGDAEESRRILAETQHDWDTMPKRAQVLRHLTLAKAAMISGDQALTQIELEAAQQLEPNNPACLLMAFDKAIGEGRWAKARELSRIIATQTWHPKNTLFETKRAVLAIHENNVQELSDSLHALEDLPLGDACIDYVNGVYALSQGQLQEGKALLERALNSGLEGSLKADAQKSLDQVTARQNAERILRSIVVDNQEP